MLRSSPPQMLLDTLELDGRVVADIGCGTGAIARAMAGAGARVVGIDVKQSAIDAARAEPAVNGESFVLAAAEQMPFADGSQDLVVFHNSMHHVAVDGQATAIAEAARVLVPGGAIEVSRALRMPCSRISALRSSSRSWMVGDARYFLASKSGNAPFSLASSTLAR